MPTPAHKTTPAECEGYALADALDATPTVTWGERPERAGRALYDSFCEDCGGKYSPAEYREAASIALRAGFPELAPGDD